MSYEQFLMEVKFSNGNDDFNRFERMNSADNGDHVLSESGKTFAVCNNISRWKKE